MTLGLGQGGGRRYDSQIVIMWKFLKVRDQGSFFFISPVALSPINIYWFY